MKSVLICPATRRSVSHLAEAMPFATVPLLGECLITFWLGHLASLGARDVIVLVADRAELVRRAVGDGRRWGLRVEVVTVGSEPTVGEAAARCRPFGEPGWLPAPDDLVVMNHLPGCAALPLFESYAGWCAALQAWIPQALTPGRVRMRELHPGIWVGSGARVAPRAQLHAPCWIGDHVAIETDAVIGPGAILEDRVVVGEGARVVQSVIGPDTFVGRLTAVVESIAAGSLLINWRSESVLRVPDSFLLCSLGDMPSLVPQTHLAGAAGAFGRTVLRWLKRLRALFSRSNCAAGTKPSG